LAAGNSFQVGRQRVLLAASFLGEFGSRSVSLMRRLLHPRACNLSHIEAASAAGELLRLSGIDRGNLQVGEVILIHAGAGG